MRIIILSIDLRMYRLAELKDRGIAKVKRIRIANVVFMMKKIIFLVLITV